MNRVSRTCGKVKLGCEVLLENVDVLRGKQVGVVSNPTGVTSNLDPVWKELRRRGVTISALFGPEHGFAGNTQDALPVEDSNHEIAAIPVYSLYGQNLQPTPGMLKNTDVLVFDIQDVGVRFYTYISTMALCMKTCASIGKPFWVLDRPNPLGGRMVAGPVLDPRFSSFLGLYPIPIMHGMTVGELACLFNEEFDIGCNLTIIPMDGWSREMMYDDTELKSWVMPSPNLPTLDTVTGYPGTCLVEGTNISEGRGTTRPFELIGAPWIDGEQLTDCLNGRSLPGVKFRSVVFTPTFWKYTDETCEGVQVHVLDRRSFDHIRTGLTIIEVIRELHPNQFSWRWDPSVDLRCFFDLLAGTDKVRSAIEEGNLDEAMRKWRSDINEFLSVRGKYLLYD